MMCGCDDINVWCIIGVCHEKCCHECCRNSRMLEMFPGLGKSVPKVGLSLASTS